MKRLAAVLCVGMLVGAYCSPLSPIHCGKEFVGTHGFVWSCRW